MDSGDHDTDTKKHRRDMIHINNTFVFEKKKHIKKNRSLWRR